jgi:hypothetical protein
VNEKKCILYEVLLLVVGGLMNRLVGDLEASMSWEVGWESTVLYVGRFGTRWGDVAT